MDTTPVAEPRSRSLRLVTAAVAWLPASLLLGGPAAVCLPVVAAFGPGPGLSAVLGIALAVLVQPFVGRAADRGFGGLRRRGWSIVGVVVAAIGLGVLAASLASPRTADVAAGVAARDVAVTVADAAVIVAQIGAGILLAAQRPLLAEAFDRPSRGAGAGLRIMFELAGAAIGIVALAGPPLVLAILAVVLVAGGSAALATGIVATAGGPRTDDPRRSGDAAPIAGSEAVEAARWRGRRSFWWVLVAQLLFVAGVGCVLRVLPAFMAGALGAADAALPRVLLLPRDVLQTSGAIGLVAPLLGVAAILAIPAGWASDRIGRRVPLVAGGWAAMCGAAALATATDATGTAVGALLVAAGFGLALPAQLALAADLAPGTALGSTLALLPIAAVAGAAVSALAEPASMLAASTDGLRLVLALAAVAFAGAGLAGLRAYRFVPAELLAEESITGSLRPTAAPDRPRRT